ncbi:hypothetical protein ACFSTC_46920 [Nonomuraea ferruginea]
MSRPLTGPSQRQRQVELLADAGGHVLALEPAHAAHDHQVLAPLDPQAGARERGGQVHGPQRGPAQRLGGAGELGVGDAVDGDLVREGVVEGGVLVQVPVQGVQDGRAVQRRQHAGADHFEVVVDEVDVVAAAQFLGHARLVGVGDAHDLVVRLLQVGGNWPSA